MENKKLYPELADYIFNYCGKYFWEEERLANIHLEALLKSSNSVNTAMYKFLKERGRITTNEETLALAKDGFEAFKARVTERIFKEHGHELKLNLCPKCGKVARTPRAKQCRFCFHDWH
jgi:hypothetical protein